MDRTKFKSILIHECTTIKEAMQKLSETAQQILFIINDKNVLLGTTTDGDIRRGLLNGVSFTDEIKGVYFKDFISLRKGVSNLNDCAKRLMIENKIEKIPILDANGVIIDVISWIELFGECRVDKKKYTNQVVIMAGGKGSRLNPFTNILPKPLIPVGNKSIVEHIMGKFSLCGFHKFIYTLNYKKEYIKLFLAENDFPYDIDYVEENEFLGTAGSISLLKDKISDTFFVANCDSLLNVDYVEILKWHKEHDALITIVGCHNEVKIPFGVLELSNGKLDHILEKPVHDVIINTGVYIMEPEVISLVPDNERMDMNELIESLVKKEKISVYPIYGNWFDIGQWDEYRNNMELIDKLDTNIN